MKKLFNKKGFTLMEMLIVVAIIVILVAISVPTFTANVGEAKTATDAANLRAAKAAAAMKALEANGDFIYDANKGDVVPADGASVTGYGQCSKHEDQVINVTIAGGKVTSVDWETPGACN